MAYKMLLQRIDERLDALKLSERKACLDAGVGLKSIYHIRERGHAPKPATLKALAKALKVSAEYFLDASADIEGGLANNNLARIYVVGSVQAGEWQSALEREPDDWYTMTMPADNRYPDMRLFGLEVHGNSMNEYYPNGTVVFVIPYGDLGRTPTSGERVVVLRRERASDTFEATIKEYQQDDRGRHILWPRSRDPDFQTPIILSDDDLPPVSFGAWANPDWSTVSEMQPGGHEGNIMIVALVVGSYRRE